MPSAPLRDFISLFNDVYYYVGSLQHVHNPRLTTLVANASIVVSMKPSILISDLEDSHLSDASSVIAISRAAR